MSIFTEAEERWLLAMPSHRGSLESGHVINGRTILAKVAKLEEQLTGVEEELGAYLNHEGDYELG